jgi:hypothetical protein
MWRQNGSERARHKLPGFSRAGRIAEFKVFQRSPGYIIPRADRPYTVAEKARFTHVPLAMKFHRATILGAIPDGEAFALAEHN